MKTIVIFIRTSDFKQKIFSILAKDFRHACQNCILPVRKKFLAENFFRKVFFSSLKNSIAWPKQFLEFWLKIVGRLVETAFHVSRGTFWEKLFPVKKLESLKIFRNWTEEFSTLTRFFRHFRQNCILPVQKNILNKSIFFERNTFSKILSDFE